MPETWGKPPDALGAADVPCSKAFNICSPVTCIFVTTLPNGKTAFN